MSQNIDEILFKTNLLINYSLSKTLSENLILIYEQQKNVKITGPYTLDNLPFMNGKIIIDKGGKGSGYYLIQNNSLQELIIEDVSSSEKEGKLNVVYNKTPIKKGQILKLFIEINDIIKTEPKPYNYPTFDVLTPQNYKSYDVNKSISNDNVKTPKLFIKTNLGNYEVNLNYGYSDTYIKTSEAANNFRKKLSIFGGKKVPEGFSPFEFDEFLLKLYNLTKECPNLKSNFNKFNIKEQIIGTTGYETIKSDQKTESCNTKYKKLVSEYYNNKFPNGITQEDKIDFNTENQKNITAIENFKKSHLTTRQHEPFDEYFDPTKLSEQDKKIWEKLQNSQNVLYKKYGYDSRNMFDKFMDSGWGQLAQFGAVAVLTIAGFFTEGATWLTAADMLLNISLGSYYVGRGNVREGLIFFLFAGMGKLHSLYSYLGGKLGRTIGGQSLESLSKSIATKLAGVSITNQVELNSFMYSVLNKSERKVFRELLTTLENNPKIVQDALENYAKEIAKARGVYKDINFLSAMKMKPQISKFVKNTITDLAITIPLVQKLYDELKINFKNIGIDITWGEKDKELLDYLAENKTEIEIKKIFDTLTQISKNLDDESKKYYQNELNNLKKEELDKFQKMNQIEIENYRKELIKKTEEYKQTHTKPNPKLSDPEYIKQKLELIKKSKL